MQFIHRFLKFSDFLEGTSRGSHSLKEKVRIRAINIFPIFLVPILLIFLLIVKDVNQTVITGLIIFLIVMSLMPVILNLLKQFEWANTLYTYQSPILVLFYTFLLGDNLGIQYFFIVLFAYPFIFFGQKSITKSFIFFAYNTFCLFYLELGINPIQRLALDPTTTYQIKILVLVILFIFCGILLTAFYFMVQKNEIALIKKSEELEKAYGMKQDFLATMSHELRTPLNAVVTITSLLDDNPNRTDKEKLINLLKFSSNNLLSIINDILDFSKLEVSKIKLDNRPHELKKLLSEICDTYKNLADEKGLALKLNIDTEIKDVYKVDDVKLGQVLGNLIGNAIKFTDLGRISVNVKLMEESVFNDILHFEIIDTGSGIPDTELEEIFESFAQSKLVTTRKKDGTGLGLAIVKRLLNLYDSEIKVTSVVGQGSNFSFELSMKRGGQLEFLAEEQIETLNNKKLLLVEDNTINAMVAEKLLGSWGIVSITAKNGEEAVNLCRKEEFDVILMDLHMPIMDGFTAAKTIREVENINMYTPIFALTADVTGENNRGYNKYFDGFLTKPIQKDKLQKLLVTQLS